MADTILLIGQQSALAAELREMLAEAEKDYPAFGMYRLEVAASATAVSPSLAQSTVLIVLPLLSGSADILQRIAIVREARLTQPILLLAAAAHEQTAIATLSAGARDYLVRERLTSELLIRTIAHAARAEQALPTSMLGHKGNAARRFNLLNELTQAAIGLFDFEELLQVLADRLGTLFEADGCHIALWDEARQQPIPMAASGPMQGKFRTIPIYPDRQTLTASVLREEQVLAVENPLQSPYIDPRIAAMFPQNRALLGLPLIANGQKLGAAILIFSTPQRFTDDFIAWGEQAAGQIALAVAKARLLQTEREQRQLAEALRDAALTLGEELDVDVQLERLMELIERVAPYDTAVLLLVEEDKARPAHLRGYAALGYDVEAIQQIRLNVQELSNLRRIAQAKRPLRIPDTARDPMWRQIADIKHIRSWLGAPIMIQGELVAILSLEKVEPNFYRPDHLERVMAFAGQAALSLQNARFFQEAQRQLEELSTLHAVALAGATMLDEDALIAEATRIIGETLYPLNFGVLLLDDSGQILTPHPSYHLDAPLTYDPVVTLHDSVSGQVVRRGEPILISDVEWVDIYREIDPETRSELCVPLKVNGRVIGVINTESREPDAFAPEDLRLLTTFAGQLATAIERIRLMETERRQRQEAETLREANMALSTSLDLHQVTDTVLTHLRRVVPYDSSTVMLCRDEYLQVIAKTGLSGPEAEALLGARFPAADDRLFAEIRETQRPLCLKDAQADERFRGWGGTHATRSWLGIPLLARGEVIGLLTLDHQEVDAYDAHQMELAQMFANQAAVAIDNARLFQATQHNAEELQLTADILRRLNASPDVTAVFTHVTRQLKSLTDCQRATIVMLDPGKKSGYFFTLDRRNGRSGKRLSLQLKETSAAADVLAGRPHLTPDLAAEREKKMEAQLYQEGVRSRINLPLIVEGEVTGALNLGWEKTAAYNLDQLPLLQQIASALALALERGRLYKESDRRAAQLTVINEMAQQMTGLLSVEELCRLVTQQLHDSFNYTNVAILLREPAGGDELLLQALMGPETAVLQPHFYRQRVGEGLIGQAAATGEVVLVNDTRQHPDFIPPQAVAVASELVAPLQAGGRVIGVLKVDGRAPNAFDQEDLATLTTIGDQLAVAIEKARLFQETQQRTAELERLVAVSGTLRAAASVTEILEATMSQVRDVIPSERAAIFLLEEASQMLVAQCIDPPQEIRLSLSPQIGIVAEVLAAGQPYVTADLGRDPLAQVMGKGETAVSPGGSITLPLQTQKRAIGVIQILLAPETEPAPPQLRLLTGIAEIAGSALDRALVLETLEQRVASRTQELQAANEQLQQLDRLKSKFISDVSHELRTPIANFNLYLDLMFKGREERQEHYLHVLQQQTDRLNNLLEDVLSLSRLEMGQHDIQMAPVDLNPVIEQVVTAHRPRAEMDGLMIQVDLQSDLPPVRGERNQLAQVMTNLLSNAINYTPEGLIVVRTRWLEEGHQACLEVSDTGLGIPEADRPYLFDRFYRGQQAGQSTIPGTGLGLAIVKEIVDLHRGEITVESNVGEGTTFSIYLPLAMGSER